MTRLSLSQLDNLRLSTFGTTARLAGWKAEVTVAFDGTGSSVRILDGSGRVVSANVVRDLGRIDGELTKMVKKGALRATDHEPVVRALVEAGANGHLEVERVIPRVKAAMARLNNEASFFDALRPFTEKGLTKDEEVLVNYAVIQKSATEAALGAALKHWATPGATKEVESFLDEFDVTDWWRRTAFGGTAADYSGRKNISAFFYSGQPLYILRGEQSWGTTKDLVEKFRVVEVGEPDLFIPSDARLKWSSSRSDDQRRAVAARFPLPVLPKDGAPALVTNENALRRLTGVGTRAS